jgi:hypothetical protein
MNLTRMKINFTSALGVGHGRLYAPLLNGTCPFLVRDGMGKDR